MGLAQLASSSGGWTIEDSPLDSARFGRPVARLTVRRGDRGHDDLVAAVRDHPADVLIARHPAELTWVPAALARTARDVVPGGGLVYWAAPGGAPAAVDRPGVDVLDARAVAPDAADDLVDDLVRDTFADYTTHYSFDPLFDPEGVLAGQSEWARSCLTAEHSSVLVLRVAEEPAGIATLALDGDDVEILLAGVRQAHQGRGSYGALLDAARAWAHAAGARRVVISTQTHNVRVQRAWARAGWTPIDAFDTAHLVRHGLLSGAIS